MPYYTEDLKKLFAYVYKLCRGRSRLISLGCLKNILMGSLEFRFTQEEFNEILQESKEKKIISEVERSGTKLIKLEFNPEEYYSKSIPQLRKYQDINYEIALRISKKLNKELSEIFSEINKLAAELNIISPVAAFILAKRLDVDVSDFLADLWRIVAIS